MNPIIRRKKMKKLKVLALVLILLFPASSLHAEVIPEMQECMSSHESQELYRSVLEKYCDSEIIRKAMALLVIKDPYVINTEKSETGICYTVKGTTVDTSFELPNETTQIYRVQWDGGKIVSLSFLGTHTER